MAEVRRTIYFCENAIVYYRPDSRLDETPSVKVERSVATSCGLRCSKQRNTWKSVVLRGKLIQVYEL